MGALEIRRSSANLQQLGNIAKPVLNTGASEVFEAQAREAKAAGEAARVRGHAAIEGIMRRGQIVNNTMRHLAGIAEEIMNRENQRQVDLAIVEKEEWQNTFMNGDGTEQNVGKFNETINNTEEWLKSINDANKQKDEEIGARLNAAQRGMFERRVAADNMKWNARVGAHAAKVTLQNQVVAAEGLEAMRLKEASFAAVNPDPVERDKAIADYYDSVISTLDAKFVPEAQREAMIRKKSFELISATEKVAIDKWTAETADEEDRTVVEKRWGEIIDMVEKDESVFSNEQIRKGIGSDGLTKAEKELLVDRLKKARRTAANTADALFRQRKYQSHQDARDAEIQQMQTWDTMAQSGTPATDSAKAEWYSELARKNSWSKDENGNEIRQADGVQYPLGKYDRDTQAYYLSKAEYWRNMEKRSKAAVDREETKEAKEARIRLENDLGFRLLAFKLTNDADFTDGVAAMSEDEYSQYIKDRKALTDEVIAESKSKGISYAKSKEFMGILDKNFSAEEKEAARDFLAFFGFDRDTYSSLGSARKAVASHSGNTPEPIGETGHWYTLGIKTKDWVKNEDCLKLFDGYMREMKAMPRGADKGEYTKKCLDHVAERSANLDIESCIDYFSNLGRQYTNRDMRQTAENLKALEGKKKNTKKESK